MTFLTLLVVCAMTTVIAQKSADVCWSDDDCAPYAICAHIKGNGVCVCRFNRMGDDGHCLPDDLAMDAVGDEGSRGSTSPGPALCPNLYFGGLKVPERNRNCINGAVCISINSTLSVCVCDHGWSGKTCNRRLLRKEDVKVDNPIKVKGMKYENLQSFAANIIGRHFAKDADQCIALCVATNGVCKSANFGSYNGDDYICEMLGLVTYEGDFMDKAGYHVKANGWTYVYDDKKR